MGHLVGMIDLGSNTARLVVYYRDDQGILYENDNIKQVLRLSDYVRDDLTIDRAGFQATLDCMRRFKELCDARQVSEIVAVATAAVRQAANGAELLEAIRRETGIEIRLLSGEEEARYGYLAVVHSMKIENAFTVDIGGGSTEITRIENRKLKASVSFPFGIVTLTRQFLPAEIPSADDLARLREYLRQQFATQPWLAKGGHPLVAMGGTARNLAKIHQRQRDYSMASLHHYVMKKSDVGEILKWISRMPLDVRKQINGLSKDRADVIIAGIAALYALLEWIGSDQLITSNKGLRDGVLFEKTYASQNGFGARDIVRLSREQFMARYHVDKAHATHVRDLALALYDDLNRLHILKMGDAERELLESAALLHDVGRSINVYETSRHTFYLLSNVLLLGLTHRERLLIAMIASYKSNKQLQNQLRQHHDIVGKEDKPAIEKLGHLILLARTLDRSMTRQIKTVRLREQKNGIVMECLGTRENLMEYTLLNDILGKVSKIFKRPFFYEAKTVDSFVS